MGSWNVNLILVLILLKVGNLGVFDQHCAELLHGNGAAVVLVEDVEEEDDLLVLDLWVDDSDDFAELLLVQVVVLGGVEFAKNLLDVHIVVNDHIHQLLQQLLAFVMQ